MPRKEKIEIIIDEDDAIDNFGEDTYRENIFLFVEGGYKHVYEGIKEGEHILDSAKMKILTHTLKTTARYMSSENFAQICQGIESETKAPNWDKIFELLPDFYEYLEILYNKTLKIYNRLKNFDVDHPGPFENFVENMDFYDRDQEKLKNANINKANNDDKNVSPTDDPLKDDENINSNDKKKSNESSILNNKNLTSPKLNSNLNNNLKNSLIDKKSGTVGDNGKNSNNENISNSHVNNVNSVNVKENGFLNSDNSNPSFLNDHNKTKKDGLNSEKNLTKINEIEKDENANANDSNRKQNSTIINNNDKINNLESNSNNSTILSNKISIKSLRELDKQPGDIYFRSNNKQNENNLSISEFKSNSILFKHRNV